MTSKYGVKWCANWAKLVDPERRGNPPLGANNKTGGRQPECCPPPASSFTFSSGSKPCAACAKMDQERARDHRVALVPLIRTGTQPGAGK